jgi:ABC-type branched-subunit amino acid transport system substrate-binding protein
MLRTSRRFGAGVVLTAGVVSLAACGSQITPDVAAAARGYQNLSGNTGSDTAGTTGSGGAVADQPLAGADSGQGGGSGGGQQSRGGGHGDRSKPPTGRPKQPKGVSCDGFKNSTGMTNDTITIANASDISGPVPGLFEASRDATRAFVAYFNATNSICGRKLKLLELDSATDAGADQQAYAKACEQAFAAVGSMSAFDSGGAKVAENCGLPDIRSASVTAARNACSTCFGAQSANANGFENAPPDYFLRYHHEATQHAAFLWLNGGAASENAAVQKKVEEKRGFKFVYSSGIDTAEFNYTPYVQQMKDKGVQWVQFLGSYQHSAKLAKAMEQQNFHPIYLNDPTVHNSDFIKLGGSAVEDSYAFINYTPFDEASSNTELQLYTTWLHQVQPDAEPSFFGLFSWSAARLFADESLALGGKLTRANLVERLRKVDNWTANGLHSKQHVGSKRIGDCWQFMQVKNGRWVRAPHSNTYMCDGVTYLK